MVLPVNICCHPHAKTYNHDLHSPTTTRDLHSPTTCAAMHDFWLSAKTDLTATRRASQGRMRTGLPSRLVRRRGAAAGAAGGAPAGQPLQAAVAAGQWRPALRTHSSTPLNVQIAQAVLPPGHGADAEGKQHHDTAERDRASM